MLSTPPKGGGLFVEPLEQRIAPTNLVALANHPSDSGAANYVTYTTAPASGKLGFVPASNYGVNGPANLYAIALSGDGTFTTSSTGSQISNGDQIQIFTADGYRTFLQAANSNLVAFFLDSNNDGQVQNTELVGLAVGKKGAVNVNGNVNGDIVTNLAKDGTLTLNTAGNGKQSITGLNISGNVFGSIASGGDIANVTINGNVNAILAGSAANGLAYHFSGPGAATGTVAFPGLADLKLGASIDQVTLFSITDRIQSGDGGGGAKGGSITALTIQGDSDGFTLLSGNGGNAGENLRGGTGGDISNVTVAGVIDTTHSLITIQAGHGGDNTVFKGGTGGSISGVATSFAAYDANTNTGTVSNDLLADNIVVHAGDGGNGLRGGKGGSVTGSQIYGSILDDGTANAEIQVLAGNGGINSAAGDGAKAGKGGLISQVTAENVNVTAFAQNASILVQAGNGGASQAGGNGRLGGNIDSLILLGGQLFVNAGNGSSGGNAGGAGGSLDGIRVDNTLNLFANTIALNAGTGGSSGGIGGAGGNINMVRVLDSDLVSLLINSGVHANGGVGTGGAGGAGGGVTDVQIGDSGAFRATPTPAVIRSGVGGDGTAGAGAGGSIDAFQLLGSELSYSVVAGNGGNVLDGGAGRGGAGGSLTNIGIATTLDLSNKPAGVDNATYSAGFTGTLTSGTGGNGQGKGGIGGDLAAVSLQAASNITMTAGIGGNSNARRAGNGGSVSASAGNSLFGFVTATAGNAGATGSNAGAGGSIDGLIVAAGTNITLTGGNGGAGGAGGSITNSGTSFNAFTNQANTGSLTVTAGRGSAGNSLAGVGGSITTFNGFIGGSGTTAFTAGAGGGTGDSDVSAAGGSIDQVKLAGPGGTGTSRVFVTFDAGDAGDAGQARRGVAGGSVTNVTVFNLSSTSVVQHVAAGDGGDALRHGGAGGEVSNVSVGVVGDVAADIGIRSGVAYGYQTTTGAGGIFAGLGGTGSKTSGAAGDVTNITANAIASIVAGKGIAPGLAGTVDSINLNGNTQTNANADGSFKNFSTANLVGSVQNPSAAGASTYKQGDGLIAALNVTNIRGFTPEALLTIDNGVLVLFDVRQPLLDPVITPV